MEEKPTLTSATSGEAGRVGHICLGRMVGESLNIHTPAGELIVVQLAQVGQGKGRIWISAPRNVIVKRAEIDGNGQYAAKAR